MIITIGFVMVHSTASAWVGQLASRDKGHASSLYLLAYYVGSSVLGSAAGWLWYAGGWPAVITYCSILLTMIFGIAHKLRASPVNSA